jgi:hypothetical protein
MFPKVTTALVRRFLLLRRLDRKCSFIGRDEFPSTAAAVLWSEFPKKLHSHEDISELALSCSSRLLMDSVVIGWSKWRLDCKWSARFSRIVFLLFLLLSSRLLFLSPSSVLFLEAVKLSTSSISLQHSSLLDNTVSSVLELTMQSLLSSNCHTREETSTVSTTTSAIDIMIATTTFRDLESRHITFTHCCHCFSFVLLCCQILSDTWYMIFDCRRCRPLYWFDMSSVFTGRN